ncbi:MAG: chemotaxis response regulator protein-glutamate methylesterase [Trichlorobacter sp.]|uniref:protein-glutamate methylesterase/protein-glutamine glutaminase n=1 Tax=Trichlorobacter sp. TaxID=2911007 RepID=UPI00256CC47E|nr:chemotaxis response regulator protein-glutamate methylesterase [Trichlorobacter sp.]MDK9716791.1 chemotaxis response regulator protein-glutamate methylesterase [Trichlorobacter sp.]
MPCKVLIIDDSALIRNLLSTLIDAQPDMTVVGTAADPYIARERIKALNPDVLTLDVEMPRMDGLSFLEKLMRLRPMPVVMVSSLTERSSETTLRALELGAVDYVSKPKIDIINGINESGQEIVEKIRAASGARLKSLVRKPVLLQVEKKLTADVVLPSISNRLQSTEKVVIVGASTGGTEAIREVLVSMPADAPGILITQHMPAAFTSAFARRLDGLCRIAVKEAQDGERVLPGHAYIAPGDRHLLLDRSGANYITKLADGPPVCRHRPSVDVLFRSAANCAGKNAIGVILTGMGDDGATGMLEMKQAGACTLAQDEESCVVFGMPKEAIIRGGVDEVVTLSAIPERIVALVSGQGMRAIRV